MADPNSANLMAKKQRDKLLNVAGVRPYWRYVFLKTIMILILMLFSFRAVAHARGVDMSARSDVLAKGDSNEKIAAAIIRFSMIPDPLFISK